MAMHAHVTGWSAFAAMGSQVTFGRHEIGHDGAHGIDVGHFAHASSTKRIQNLTLFNRLIRYLLPCETQNTFYVQDACRYHIYIVPAVARHSIRELPRPSSQRYNIIFYQRIFHHVPVRPIIGSWGSCLQANWQLVIK